MTAGDSIRRLITTCSIRATLSLRAGYQPYDSIVNFTNWDTFFYTRYVSFLVPSSVDSLAGMLPADKKSSFSEDCV